MLFLMMKIAEKMAINDHVLFYLSKLHVLKSLNGLLIAIMFQIETDDMRKIDHVVVKFFEFGLTDHKGSLFIFLKFFTALNHQVVSDRRNSYLLGKGLLIQSDHLIKIVFGVAVQHGPIAHGIWMNLVSRDGLKYLLSLL